MNPRTNIRRKRLKSNEANTTLGETEQYATITRALTKWTEQMNIALAKAKEEKSNAEKEASRITHYFTRIYPGRIYTQRMRIEEESTRIRQRDS